MAFSYHKNITGADLHVPGYAQTTDPGTVGASKYWIDTSSGTNAWILKVRNSANTNWETIAGSETLNHAQLLDMPDIGGTNSDHDTRYYTETEIDTNFVPYTGATATLNLGAHAFITTSTGRFNSLGVGTAASGNAGEITISGHFKKDGSAATFSFTSDAANSNIELWDEYSVPLLFLHGGGLLAQGICGVSDTIGNQLILTNLAVGGHQSNDYDHAVCTNPTLFIHSDTDPDDNNTEWGSLYHTGTGTGDGAFTILSGTGEISMGDDNLTLTGTISDGVLTISDGNITSMGNITGSDTDISAGTGSYTSTGIIQTTSTGRFDGGLTDSTPVVAIDLVNRQLENSSGTAVGDWENSILYDNSGVESISFNNRILTDENDAFAVDFTTNRFLARVNMSHSLDWETGQWIASDGTVQGDYNTAGTLDFQDNAITTLGAGTFSQINSDSYYAGDGANLWGSTDGSTFLFNMDAETGGAFIAFDILADNYYDQDGNAQWGETAGAGNFEFYGDVLVPGTLTADDQLRIGSAAGTEGGDDNMIKCGSGNAFLNIKGGGGKAKVSLSNDRMAFYGGNSGTNPGIHFRTNASSSTNQGTLRQYIDEAGLIAVGGGLTPTTLLDIAWGGVTYNNVRIGGTSATTGESLYIRRNSAAAGTDSPMVNFIQDATTDDQVAVRIQGDSTTANTLEVYGSSYFDNKVIFTQTDGNEAIDSLNDNYMDYLATTGHRFNNPIHVDTINPYGANVVTLGEATYGVTVPGNLDADKRVSSGASTFSTEGPTDNVNAAEINTLFINTASNNVTIGGFIGGVYGQELRVVVINATNNTILEHAEGHANQQIFLHAGVDETLDGHYGGWNLVCDGNHWYDESHAKHV